MRKLAAYFGAFILVIQCASAATADESTNSVLTFADHLYAQGDYYRAITEYKRFIFQDPSNPKAGQAEYRIGMSYMNGEKYEAALQLFSDLADRRSTEEAGKKALLMAAECYSKMGMNLDAAATMEKYLTRYSGDPDADSAKLRVAWYLMREGDMRKASEKLHAVPEQSPFRNRAEKLLKETEDYGQIALKSPALAGGLSAVIPGAGQFYVGRPRDGAVSFLINGCLIWAAAEAFENDQEFAGSLFALLEVSWYTGNIYNAANGANKVNRLRRKAFLDDVEVKCGLTLVNASQPHREHETGSQTVPVVALGFSF